MKRLDTLRKNKKKIFRWKIEMCAVFFLFIYRLFVLLLHCVSHKK